MAWSDPWLNEGYLSSDYNYISGHLSAIVDELPNCVYNEISCHTNHTHALNTEAAPMSSGTSSKIPKSISSLFSVSCDSISAFSSGSSSLFVLLPIEVYADIVIISFNLRSVSMQFS
uniref:CSON008659 protein n=1 Tax=Culicoides sonorensis TaxID=179676 RepID=A0A336N1K3_CULSO